MSFISTTDTATLAEGALAAVLLGYVAPPLAQLAGDKIRGYAGERGGTPMCLGGRRQPSALVLVLAAALAEPLAALVSQPPCAGDMLPTTVFDALVSHGGNVLVDVRTAAEKEDDGVPDLPDAGAWRGGGSRASTLPCTPRGMHLAPPPPRPDQERCPSRCPSCCPSSQVH